MPWQNFVDGGSVLPKAGGCSVAIQELDSIILVGSFQLRLFCGSVTAEGGGQDIKKRLPY